MPRHTFSLPDDLSDRLTAMPAGTRSQMVADAIALHMGTSLSSPKPTVAGDNDSDPIQQPLRPVCAATMGADPAVLRRLEGIEVQLTRVESGLLDVADAVATLAGADRQ